MGFDDDVQKLAKHLPTTHQNVIFSIAFDHRVRQVKSHEKQDLLLHLLHRPEISRVLVFTRTKAMADLLTQQVKAKGLAADAIHCDLEQSMRQRVVKNFRAGQVNVLIATDVAARGIDVPDITHVINYDMPLEAEAYVHRVGRTGRAGATGVALSICVAKENALLQQIERLIGIKVRVDRDQPFHDDRAVVVEAVSRPTGRGFAGKGNGPARFGKVGDARPAGGRITPLRRHSAKIQEHHIFTFILLFGVE